MEKVRGKGGKDLGLDAVMLKISVSYIRKVYGFNFSFDGFSTTEL